jgi:hypothetical protein
MKTVWQLKAAEITYSCLQCNNEAVLDCPPPLFVTRVSGVCPICYSLMGISNVRYITVDDKGETVHPVGGNQIEQPSMINADDSDAAAALGIDLQHRGGPNESEKVN